MIKNLSIWIIALIAVIIFLIGIFYYEILGAVVNPFAFIVSLTIIFLILILVILFSQKNPKNRIPYFEEPRVEIMEKDVSEKKLKVSKNKVKKK